MMKRDNTLLNCIPASPATTKTTQHFFLRHLKHFTKFRSIDLRRCLKPHEASFMHHCFHHCLRLQRLIMAHTAADATADENESVLSLSGFQCFTGRGSNEQYSVSTSQPQEKHFCKFICSQASLLKIIPSLKCCDFRREGCWCMPLQVSAMSCHEKKSCSCAYDAKWGNSWHNITYSKSCTVSRSVTWSRHCQDTCEPPPLEQKNTLSSDKWTLSHL